MLTACRTYFHKQNNRKKVPVKKKVLVKRWIPDTRVRIEKQSKVSEIAAPTLNPRFFFPHQSHFFPKSEKRRKKLLGMNFRNSSQNPKAVKIEREPLLILKLNIKSLPTPFSTLKYFEKDGKKSWLSVVTLLFLKYVFSSAKPAMLWRKSAYPY